MTREMMRFVNRLHPTQGVALWPVETPGRHSRLMKVRRLPLPNVSAHIVIDNVPGERDIVRSPQAEISLLAGEDSLDSRSSHLLCAIQFAVEA